MPSLPSLPSLRSLRRSASLFGAIALAAIPPALVVWFLWAGKADTGRFDAVWRLLPFFSGLDWPSWFTLVLAADAALLLLFLTRPRDPAPWFPGPPRARRRRPPGQGVLAAQSLALLSAIACFVILVRAAFFHHPPGAELVAALAGYAAGSLCRDVGHRALRRLWKRKAPGLLASAGLQAAVLIGIAAFIRGRGFPWMAAILLCFSAALAVRRRRQLSLWVWMIPLALVLRGLWLDSWWYTLVGDEYAFREMAVEIARNPIAGDAASRLFAMDGVYGQFTYLTSLVQAAGMIVAGPDNFGWKLSSLYLSALALPFYFSFFRTFAGRRVAAFACFFLAVSEYLMSFTKIGYPNLQAHFTVALLLSATAWAVRTRRTVAFCCVGLAAAACCYVYPAALYCLPLPVLLLAIYDPPRSRDAVIRWANAAAGFLLAVFPLLLQPQFFLSKLPGVFYGNPDFADSRMPPALHFARNVFYGAFSPLFKPGESHFVGISYQDPVSAGLIALGAAVVLRRGLRDPFARFCIAGAAAVLVLSASHGSDSPPTTRMFILLPGFALAAAIGLSWLLERLAASGVSASGRTAAAAVVLTAALAANVVQAYVVSPPRMALQYQGIEAVFNRTAQKARDLAPDRERHFLFLTDQWSVAYGFDSLREVYRLPPLSDVKLVEGDLPDGGLGRVSAPAALVIVRPELPARVRAALEDLLRRAGKVPCPARNQAGSTRLVVWQSPELPRFCD
ncbi:MAG: hypothetical protein ABI914_01000 [Acidobacteriota bacterium]